MKKFALFLSFILLIPCLLLAATGDPATAMLEPALPPLDRAVALDLVKNFLVTAWPALVAWLISEAMPFLPTKANGIAHLFYTWAKSKAGGGLLAIMLLFALVVSGCTTVNCSLMSGEKNTVKSDQDQTPTTPITTSIKGLPGL